MTNDDPSTGELDPMRLLDALGAHAMSNDPGFEALALVAARSCKLPVALITLCADGREWIKAGTGLELNQAALEGPMLVTQKRGEDMFTEIADLSSDTTRAHTRIHSLVPNARFFAAAPIRVAGLTLGSLVVLDREPRSLTPSERQTLASLATAAARMIASANAELPEALQARISAAESDSDLYDTMVDEVQRILLAERRQLASVIEATEVATWEYHIPDGSVAINDRWAGMLGYTREELEPVHVDDFTSFTHPDDVQTVQDALARHFQGESRDYECEIRMRHRNGHWVWLLTRGRVLEWREDGTAVRMFGVHLDIQQRKEQEESLLRMSSLLESTGGLAQVGGWELDLETQTLLWTTETKRIHGVPPDYEPDLDSAIYFYAPEAREQIRTSVERTVETGESWDVEVPLIRADGERIWVHALGQSSVNDQGKRRLFGAFQDVTERRKLLKEISESRELLRVTIESIGDGVITTDEEGRITWLNPVAERLTGWSPEAAHDLPIEDVFKAVDEHSRQPIANPVSRCLAERQVVNLAQDAILIARDGREHGVEDSAAAQR
ncbi:MAG: PAS domain S-box protein, partial [Pseudomonadota bacterium]